MDELARALVEDRLRHAAAQRRTAAVRIPWRARWAARFVMLAERLDAASVRCQEQVDRRTAPAPRLAGARRR